MDPVIQDEVYFNIKEVANQIGVVPATIRNWEKLGLFVAKRSANGYRVYDFQDIERLRLIKQRSKDDRMGTNAIRMMVQNDTAVTLTKSSDAVVSKRLLSEKWKECRQQRGYLLDEVASQLDISASYLSKIENGQANVSLDVLQRLADFYGESIAYYVGPGEESRHLVKKNQGESFSIGIPGVMVEQVSELQGNAMSALIYTAEPGCGSAGPSVHAGEEYVHLLSGKVEFTINDTQVYILRTGDNLCYRSWEPHSWKNTGSKPARILWVYTRGADQ